MGSWSRIYVVNVLEFDFVNSFHTHANFFDYYPTGTRLEPSDFTDTKMFAQGERGIMEFRYGFPGISCSTPTSASSPSSVGWASST